MTVTALSAAATLEGRQMCSSTPMVLMPCSRSGRLISPWAAWAMAFMQVSHATPRRRASAETVVSSCRSASTAHAIARAVSLARGSATRCCSVQVPRGHAGSGQRQIRLDQRTRTGRPKHGASCRTWTRRAWLTATTPQPGHPVSVWSVSTSTHTRPSSSVRTSSRCIPSTPKSSSARGHHAPGTAAAAGAHIQ
jgi:hypothetical protein